MLESIADARLLLWLHFMIIGRDVGWRKTGIKNRTRSSTNQATKWLLCFVGLGSPSTDFEPVFRGRRLIYPTIGRFDGLVFAERLRVAGTRDGMWINRNCQSIRSYTHDYCSPHLTSSTRSVVALYIHLSSSTSDGVWLARAFRYMFSTGTECVGTMVWI